MVTLLKKAVRDRERVPRETVHLAFERSRISFTREACDRARRHGRRSTRPHNQARRLVELQLLDAGVGQLRDQMVAAGAAEPSQETLRELRSGLRRSRDFRALMERLWPILTPQQLLNDLFGTPALLRSAGAGIAGAGLADLDVAEVDVMVLARDRVADPEAVVWSMEDVPLLDEAGELLGPATDEAQARLARQQRQARQHELDFANRVLSSMELDIAINAERFAERFADQSGDTIAEQAAKDRTWKFGHVIVD
jgi:hypothetical protein